jgi:elongation factor 1-beta
MGEVIVLYRILPESPEVYEEMKKAIEGLSPDKVEEEDIAFGLKALRITKVIPEADNAEETFEEKLRGIKGVKDVEMITATRSL